MTSYGHDHDGSGWNLAPPFCGEKEARALESARELDRERGEGGRSGSDRVACSPSPESTDRVWSPEVGARRAESLVEPLLPLVGDERVGDERVGENIEAAIIPLSNSCWAALRVDDDDETACGSRLDVRILRLGSLREVHVR